MPSGTPAPSFTIPDVTTGKLLTLEDVAGAKGTLIVFLCAHCPYVVHVRDVLVALAGEFALQGINAVGISSNDVVAYPEDAPDKLRVMAATSGITFPMLYDETQEVARAYTAACRLTSSSLTLSVAWPTGGVWMRAVPGTGNL